MSEVKMAVDWKKELAEADTLEEAVGLALGGASACWSNLEGAGIFDSSRASEIMDALMERIRGYVQ